jgi:membrane protease YdiL (CAAX protease family)
VTTARFAAHALLLLACGALFLHAVPGYENPQVDGRYLNFDKALAGLILLRVYARDVVTHDEGLRHIGGLLWRFALMVGVLIVLALVSGYVGWDPKAPPGWPIWLASMVFLTAMPEEALFRAVLQTRIQRWLAPRPSATTGAILIAGLLFGVAHVAGGPVYVGLSTVAGIFYGWIFASTRSFSASVAAHTGLNAVHYFFFTYPALAA